MVVSGTLKVEFPHFTVTLRYHTRLGAVQGEHPLFFQKGEGWRCIYFKLLLLLTP